VQASKPDNKFQEKTELSNTGNRTQTKTKKREMQKHKKRKGGKAKTCHGTDNATDKTCFFFPVKLHPKRRARVVPGDRKAEGNRKQC
jgi:hypothetical protein